MPRGQKQSTIPIISGQARDAFEATHIMAHTFHSLVAFAWSRRGWLAVAAVVLTSFTLRLWNISADSLWTDELGTYWVANTQSVGECAARAVSTQGQSPFYFLIVRSMLSFLPHGEFSLRLLSLLASTVTTLLVCLITRRMFGGWAAPVMAGVVTAMEPTLIYYAQEARPYALGMLFCAASQLIFLRAVERDASPSWCLPCAACAALAIYSHYIFASITMAQNAYWLWLLARRGGWTSRATFWWLGCQAGAAASLLPLARQVMGMAAGRGAWNWLPEIGLAKSSHIFLSMLRPDTALMLAGLLLIFKIVIERIDVAAAVKANLDALLLLSLWLAAPFAFALALSRLLHVSLMDERYMTLALLPYCVLLGRLLTSVRIPRLSLLAPILFVLFQATFVTIPTFLGTGQFSERVGHDWRGALSCVGAAARPGDVIVTRFGDVRENWLPSNSNPIISGYVRAPFESFYWKGGARIPIHNLTYTSEIEFTPYYEAMLNEIAKGSRVWVVGVNPPNTNYTMKRFTEFMAAAIDLRKAHESEMDFSGVYVCLLVNPRK